MLIFTFSDPALVRATAADAAARVPETDRESSTTETDARLRLGGEEEEEEEVWMKIRISIFQKIQTFEFFEIIQFSFL